MSVATCVLFHDLDTRTAMKVFHFKRLGGLRVEWTSDGMARIQMCKTMLAQSV
jgi:hypothetical protein